MTSSLRSLAWTLVTTKKKIVSCMLLENRNIPFIFIISIQLQTTSYNFDIGLCFRCVYYELPAGSNHIPRLLSDVKLPEKVKKLNWFFKQLYDQENYMITLCNIVRSWKSFQFFVDNLWNWHYGNRTLAWTSEIL